jgi:hypothetical protein
VRADLLPFTREQFFQVFAAYNAATGPMAVAAYPLALLALALAWRGTRTTGRLVAGILGLMWAWVGLAYHGVFFSRVNPAAGAFAAAFLVQAALLGLQALRAGLDVSSRNRTRRIAGAALVFYAMLAYPLVGLLTGERLPAMPLFGVTPCPLLIFTLGLLLWADGASWWLWIVPLLWSDVGGSAAVVLSVPQDWALPISAVVAPLIAWIHHSPKVDQDGRPLATSQRVRDRQEGLRHRPGG